MKNLTTLTTLFFILLLSTSVKGQFSITAEIRPRAEYRHGFSTLVSPDEDAAFFVSQRSRLNFGWQNQKLNIYFSFQDVRVWGEVPQLNRSDLNSSIHEAWAELSLTENVFLKLGRQQLVYDNARILGNVDWAQQARSHDLALLKWNMNENSRLHAGFAFNQDFERRVFTFYDLPNYKTMQFLWYNTTLQNTGLSMLFLNNGIQYELDRTVFSQTTGGRITQQAGDLDLSGSVYLQTGKDGADRKLSAWYLAAQAALPVNENISVAAGFEFLSGNDFIDMMDPEQTTNNAFTPLYGTNHAFNGHMDYFYVGNHIGDVGLINPYLSANASRDALSLTGVVHLFFAQGEIPHQQEVGQTMSSYLGTEVDLILAYTLSPETSIRLGYSHMFASQTMERIKSGSKDEINNWAWLMVVIKPVLFRN